MCSRGCGWRRFYKDEINTSTTAIDYPGMFTFADGITESKINWKVVFYNNLKGIITWRFCALIWWWITFFCDISVRFYQVEDILVEQHLQQMEGTWDGAHQNLSRAHFFHVNNKKQKQKTEQNHWPYFRFRTMILWLSYRFKQAFVQCVETSELSTGKFLKKKLLKFWNNLRKTFVIGGLITSLKGAVQCTS